MEFRRKTASPQKQKRAAAAAIAAVISNACRCVRLVAISNVRLAASRERSQRNASCRIRQQSRSPLRRTVVCAFFFTSRTDVRTRRWISDYSSRRSIEFQGDRISFICWNDMSTCAHRVWDIELAEIARVFLRIYARSCKHTAHAGEPWYMIPYKTCFSIKLQVPKYLKLRRSPFVLSQFINVDKYFYYTFSRI